MLSRAVALLLFAAACLASPAVAQIPGGSSGALAFVVTTCGTLGTPYGAGSTRLITIDVNGNLCGSGGSGGGAVTIADGADVAEGAKADAAYAGSGSASVISVLKGLYAGVTSPIPSGTNVIGDIRNITGTFTTIPTFKIDQTTPGTTNGVQLPTTTNGGAATVKGGVAVVNGGSTYQAVAASQTATVLQTSTGAIGDYLSHCVIYPTSTSPGVVTVFDNTNAAAGSAILFPGGASSVSNLAPIPVPVGAVSTAGAWKVTTGTAVSVVCYGKFSFRWKVFKDLWSVG